MGRCSAHKKLRIDLILEFSLAIGMNNLLRLFGKIEGGGINHLDCILRWCCSNDETWILVSSNTSQRNFEI